MERTSIPPPPPTMSDWASAWNDRIRAFFGHVGEVSLLSVRTIKSLLTGGFEWTSFIYQMEQLGVKSLMIGSATAIFVGIVMSIQFAFALERFGAIDSVGRIVGLSMARELAPALTSLVVGSRISAGMTAEIGSMAVTEQIDAIRSLGADPVRKLVLPRLLASVIVLPLIASFALLLGIGSAMIVCKLSFGIEMPFFVSTAIGVLKIRDLLSGIGKTPFFGFLIAILGCHFGMKTSGGTEGVGRATTQSVVVVSISILIADAILTQLFMSW